MAPAPPRPARPTLRQSQPVSDESQNDRPEDQDFSFRWREIGLGIAVVVVVIVILRIYSRFRRHRVRAADPSSLHAASQQPAPEAPPEDPRSHASSPAFAANTSDAVVHPSRAVLIGGRTIHFPADASQTWDQIYPQHVPGVRRVHALRAQGAAPPPRFNPEDLASFEATGEDRKNPCPICLGLLEEEPVSTGQCLHLMHTSCLKSWLAKDEKTACPVCRVSYAENEAANLDAALEAQSMNSRVTAMANDHTLAQTATRHGLTPR